MDVPSRNSFASFYPAANNPLVCLFISPPPQGTGQKFKPQENSNTFLAFLSSQVCIILWWWWMQRKGRGLQPITAKSSAAKLSTIVVKLLRLWVLTLQCLRLRLLRCRCWLKIEWRHVVLWELLRVYWVHEPLQVVQKDTHIKHPLDNVYKSSDSKNLRIDQTNISEK